MTRVAEKNLATLLRHMKPVLHEGEFVFCPASPEGAVATFREAEGMSAIVERRRADELGLPYDYVAAWITLTIHSDLAAVGFLAKITSALARAGISCNVVSALRHDHLFVPAERRQEALSILAELATGSNPLAAGRP